MVDFEKMYKNADMLCLDGSIVITPKDAANIVINHLHPAAKRNKRKLNDFPIELVINILVLRKTNKLLNKDVAKILDLWLIDKFVCKAILMKLVP